MTKTYGSSRFDNEGRIIIEKYPEFVLYNCYFPKGAPGQSYQDKKRAFCHECADFIWDTLASGKEVILCGDFNAARDERDVVKGITKKSRDGRSAGRPRRYRESVLSWTN